MKNQGLAASVLQLTVPDIIPAGHTNKSCSTKHMQTAPRTERIEFFKWKHAYSMIGEARRILGHIDDQSMTDAHPLHHALWAAFHVFYAKPFKQRPAIQLDETIVPGSHRNMHTAIITLRDKMFAHNDLQGLDTDQGEPLNAVFASFPSSGGVSFGFRFISPAPEGLRQYIGLCDLLLIELLQRSTAIWNAWAPNIQVDQRLTYRLNTDETPDDVLLPP